MCRVPGGNNRGVQGSQNCRRIEDQSQGDPEFSLARRLRWGGGIAPRIPPGCGNFAMLYSWVIALLRCSIVWVFFQLGLVVFFVALVVLATAVALATLVVLVTDFGIIQGSLLD